MGIVDCMEQLFAPLLMLMPVIVLFIGFKLKSVDTRIEHQTDVLKAVLQAVEKSNTLTRQLIRTYGHEPEA